MIGYIPCRDKKIAIVNILGTLTINTKHNIIEPFLSKYITDKIDVISEGIGLRDEEYFNYTKGIHKGKFNIYLSKKCAESKLGIKPGHFQVWYDNGQLEYETYYDDKYQRQGKYESWWPNGNKLEECTYKDGKRIGDVMKWWDDGKLLYEATYIDGKEHGTVRKWWCNGLIKERSKHNNGVPQGFFQSWWSDGKPLRRFTFENGEIIGLYETWSEKGEYFSIFY